MTNSLIAIQTYLGWIVSFIFLPSIGFSQDKELTDSTIVSVVNPQKQLKLWYGSEDFLISDFVVLPQFTILYNQERGRIRLLKNEDKLVIDEYDLRGIKKIMLINGTNRIGQKIKYPLGPINAWFTIQNDSTVLAGTITLKNSKSGSGYIKISIRNNALRVDPVAYINESVQKSSYSVRNTSYINSLFQLGNKQLLVTPYGFLNNGSDNRNTEINGEIYIRDQAGIFKNIYSIENSNDKLLNPVQLITTDNLLLLYDTVKDIVKIFNRDMNLLSTINLKDSDILHEKPRRFFGKSFFWDAFSNELYYKQIYEENGKNARTLYKVCLTPTITFQKKLILYTVGYTEKYINYGELFTLSSPTRYIYTVSVNDKRSQ